MEGRPVLHPVPDELRPFDVYRMPARYEEDAARSRNHYVACIIVHADGDGGVAVKLTSNPKWDGPGDIRLHDWRRAGLVHATTARCAQLVAFTRTDLQGWTGTLSMDDAVRVMRAVRMVPPNERAWL